MPNQQLVDHIRHAKAAGQGDEQIKQALLVAGWPEGYVNETSGFSPARASVMSLPISSSPVSPLPGAERH